MEQPLDAILESTATPTLVELLDALAKAAREHDCFVTLTLTMTPNEPEPEPEPDHANH